MHSDRHRSRQSTARTLRITELLLITGFISILAYFAYDGFKEIFTKPQPFKPKEAEDSIAELKADIAKAKEKGGTHKYVKEGRGERRSALSTDHPSPPRVQILKPVVEFGAEQEVPNYKKVTIVSALQEAPCAADKGDELHYLSVLNKQDYARLHGYDFILGIKQADPRLENMWNKAAWLLRALEDEERHGEWIVWMDIDTVIIDLNYILPFDEFAAKSKDLVVYGNETEVRRGHPVRGLNTGVMLVRNTPWARHFFAEVARLGRLDDHHLGKNTLSQILLKELQASEYSDGLRDQNAVIYLLKTHPEWLDRVAFLDKEICLNCYWRDLNGVTGFEKPKYERQEKVSFIQHFMGCQSCNALNRNGDLDACSDGMFHSFSFVKKQQQEGLSNPGPNSEAELAQLRELPYCSEHLEATGCQGAKPLPAEARQTHTQLDWKKIDSAIVADTLDKIGHEQQQQPQNPPESLQVEQKSGEDQSQETGQESVAEATPRPKKIERRETRAINPDNLQKRYRRRKRYKINHSAKPAI